jgi:uncharacterized protein
MAQEKPPEDFMNYEGMAQEALRGVIKASLLRAAEPAGLPGQHHFYITFKTRGPGVVVPADLAEKYPDEMTIVLQHQYWDLDITDTGFSVTLKFGGQPKNLSTPYASVTRFYDPSVQFVLQFDAPEIVDETPPPPPPTNGDDGPKVVSLDQFRRK